MEPNHWNTSKSEAYSKSQHFAHTVRQYGSDGGFGQPASDSLASSLQVGTFIHIHYILNAGFHKAVASGVEMQTSVTHLNGCCYLPLLLFQLQLILQILFVH